VLLPSQSNVGPAQASQKAGARAFVEEHANLSLAVLRPCSTAREGRSRRPPSTQPALAPPTHSSLPYSPPAGHDNNSNNHNYYYRSSGSSSSGIDFSLGDPPTVAAAVAPAPQRA